MIKHIEMGYVAHAEGYTNINLVLREQRVAFRKGAPSIKLHVGGKFGYSAGRRRCMSGRAAAGMVEVPFEVMRAMRELMLRVICPTGVGEWDRFDALSLSFNLRAVPCRAVTAEVDLQLRPGARPR